MGLLSRTGRALKAGFRGADYAVGELLGERSRRQGFNLMPVTSALTGGALGGMLGAGIDQGAGGSGLDGAGAGAALGAGLMGGRSVARLGGSMLVNGIRAGARDFSKSGAEEGFARSLRAFSPRVQSIARALAPIKQAKGEVSWDDLDQAAQQFGGPITPDELNDLKIIFSEGHSVAMVGHR